MSHIYMCTKKLSSNIFETYTFDMAYVIDRTYVYSKYYMQGIDTLLNKCYLSEYQ